MAAWTGSSTNDSLSGARSLAAALLDKPLHSEWRIAFDSFLRE
jgi:hypothetical protein